MTPETIEPILAAISGGALTIAREMAWKVSTASILLLLISVLAWWFSSRTESEDAELIALLIMVICGVGSILFLACSRSKALTLAAWRVDKSTHVCFLHSSIILEIGNGDGILRTLPQTH